MQHFDADGRRINLQAREGVAADEGAANSGNAMMFLAPLDTSLSDQSGSGRRATGIDALEFARSIAGKGAGEILLTSMDRDGTRAGFNIDLTRAIADAVPVPVIASGGVGTLDHLVEGVTLGHASAVLAASIFHFGTHTVAEAKAHMAAAGIPMRLT